AVQPSRTQVSIDAPGNQTTAPPVFFVQGWAVDVASHSGPGIDAVHVWAYPNPGSATPPLFLGVAAYGGPRPDVAALYGADFMNSGFSLSTNTLSPGSYRIAVFARNSFDGSFSAATTEITVRPAGRPYLEIDSPTTGAAVATPFLFAGWAIDTDSAVTSGVDAVHLWAYPSSGAAPIFLGVASYGGYRWDVSSLFDPASCPNPSRYLTTALGPATIYDCGHFVSSGFGMNI